MDTHAVLWWASSETEMFSQVASEAIESADELCVSSISWYELAWLAHHNRIGSSAPLRSWLQTISAQVRTVPLTTEIAATAASLPDSFPGDPADRIIYATAIERGWSLVTKDERMRNHTYPRQVTVW